MPPCKTCDDLQIRIKPITDDSIASVFSGPPIGYSLKIFGDPQSYECSRADLRRQAQQGCTGCGLLHDGTQKLLGYLLPTLADLVRLRWTSPRYHYHEALLVTVWTVRDNQLEHSILLKFMLEEKPSEPMNSLWSAIGYAPHQAVLHDPKSSQSLEKIRYWMAECTSRHRDCKETSARLPKRILDVGQANSQVISIYTTKGEMGRYIALSHCWGPVEFQPLRTMANNIKDLENGIPWSKLSKTFQDAIWLTQSLGVRYLWIDSLCIIQDDKEDWKEQSGEMAGIYGGSYLTIAATRAPNGHIGCFDTPSGQCKIRPNVIVRREYSHRIWHDSYHSDLGTKNNPLIRRAWCLQERLLSARVLHFAAHEMVFECNSQITCECKAEIGRHLKEVFSGGRESLAWSQVIRNYASTEITKHTDYLEALSGIAKSYAVTHGKTYIAGLWRDELPAALLWRSLAGSSRPPSYTSPSFSWASRKGPIVTEEVEDRLRCHGSYEDHLSVVHAVCETDRLNPYGTVYSGFLTVNGTLIPGSIRRIVQANGEPLTSVSMCVDEILALGQKGTPKIEDDARQRIKLGLGVTTTAIHFDTEEDSRIGDTPRNVYCVFVQGNTYLRRDIWKIPLLSPTLLYRISCLLLVKNDEGQYSRIGRADFMEYLNWDKLLPRTEFTII